MKIKEEAAQEEDRLKQKNEYQYTTYSI